MGKAARQAGCRLNNGFKDHFGLRARRSIPGPQHRREQHQGDQATHNSSDGHKERGHQPVPDLDVFHLKLLCAADDRVCHQEHKVLHQERRTADHHHQHHQQRGRPPHAKTWVMGLGRIVITHGAQEGVTDETEAIGRRKERANDRKGRHQPGHAKEHRMRGLLQHHLFGQEAVEERNACHRQRGNRRNHKGHRHQVPQAT